MRRTNADVRAIGVATTDPGTVTAFVAECERRGLRAHGSADGVAVAWTPDTRPAVGFALHDDGSFVLLDGELLAADGAPPGGADEQAARLLAHLHGGRGFTGLHLEAMVTWWDARRREVTVARDHSGVCAALLAEVGDTTIWSSEPEALLAAGLVPEPDLIAIDELLTLGWVATPRWYLRGVTALPAGHLATVRPGTRPVVAAHHLHTARPVLEGSPDEQSAAFGRAVTAAVARRAHGRIGAFLSAGADSAMVVGVLRRTLDVPVETFTFHYQGYEGQHNEDEYAAETARLLGAPHTVLDVRPDDLADRFAELVGAFQSPLSFGVHSFLQDGVQALGLDAVLGGSDPGFWHDHGRPGVLAAGLRRLPPPAQLAVLRAARRTGGVPKLGVLSSGALLASHGMAKEHLSPAQRRRLFGGTPAAEALASDLAAATRLYDDEPIGHRTGFVFEQFIVPEYVGLWNLRWGRAYGYPVRAPLWDIDVMAVADSRPDRSGDKPLLRRFADAIVPDGRANAPKIFQEMPLAPWFRGPLRDFARDALSPERVTAAGLFDAGAISGLLDEHLAGVADHRWSLWSAMTAVEWALGLRPAAEPLLKG